MRTDVLERAVIGSRYLHMYFDRDRIDLERKHNRDSTQPQRRHCIVG